MNNFTAEKFNDPTDYPGLTQKNNVNTDPGFNSTVEAQFNTVLNYVIRITEANSTWDFQCGTYTAERQIIPADLAAARKSFIHEYNFTNCRYRWIAFG